MQTAQLRWTGPDRHLITVPLEYRGAMLVIGRDRNVSVVVAGDRSTSRQHAGLTYADGTWFLEDVKSTLGTFLIRDRERTKVYGRVPLRDGDRIGMGRTMLKFVCEPDDPAEPGDYFQRTVDLTERQSEILEKLCENRLRGAGGPPSNKTLADHFVLSIETIRSHLGELYRKFDLLQLPDKERKGALIETAVSEGLVRPDR